jgi:hypothetical protein
MFCDLKLRFLVAQAARAADKADKANAAMEADNAKADYRAKLESLEKAKANAASVLELQPPDMREIVLSQQLVQFCQTHVDVSLEAYKDAKVTATALMQQVNAASADKLEKLKMFHPMKWALLALAKELALSADKPKANLWTNFLKRRYGKKKSTLKRHVEPKHDHAKLVRVLYQRTIHAVVSDMYKEIVTFRKRSVEHSEFNIMTTKYVPKLKSVFGSFELCNNANGECVQKTTEWDERDDATQALHEQLEAEAYDAWEWKLEVETDDAWGNYWGFLGPLHVPNPRAHEALVGQQQDDLLPKWRLNAMGRALAGPTVLSY